MPRARYKNVVDRLAGDIRSARLAPGTKLPTHRELAADEGLALATASRVYAELAAMGLVSGETGRGTFVRETFLPPGTGMDQHAPALDLVDLNFNAPSLGGQDELLRRALRNLSSQGDLEALLRYQPHGGRRHERGAVARHLRRHGVPATSDRVLIVSGAQHGLAVTAIALLQPGDVVAIDALSYPGFKMVARAHSLELAPIPITSDGPDLGALARLCATRRVRAIYTMPTLHNPLGWVTTLEVRLQLVEIARAYGLHIIEDATYAFLAEGAPEPLAALAPELTVYVSTLSKSVATGLRFGFVAAPSVSVPLIERAIRATTWNTPALVTAIASEWLDDGTVARLEEKKRADARRRQSVAREVFEGIDVVGHPTSYILWIPLTGEARADRIAAELMHQNVSVSTAEPFATTQDIPHAVRVAVGSVDLDVLRAALCKVAQVVREHTVL
ncbi:GntR family transcriptional regulator [Rhodococcus sp. ADH]|nr:MULTISPECIES: PLP-dependent aminotransferase family protein [Rhodococcus]KPH20773.1 GntR family transcriptional regulator [Rhodococcus sp. ADH]RGP48036.1 GntR family transcriptional regulator [Rhodococcus erythropolis]